MLINRTAYALTGIDLNMDRQALAGTVGLVLRVKGDGLTYAVTLTTGKLKGGFAPLESFYVRPATGHGIRRNAIKLCDGLWVGWNLLSILVRNCCNESPIGGPCWIFHAWVNVDLHQVSILNAKEISKHCKHQVDMETHCQISCDLLRSLLCCPNIQSTITVQKVGTATFHDSARTSLSRISGSPTMPSERTRELQKRLPPRCGLRTYGSWLSWLSTAIGQRNEQKAETWTVSWTDLIASSSLRSTGFM